MVDLLGERGKKNQGVQHKNCQEPALQMTAKTSGAQLSQPLKLPLRLRSTGNTPFSCVFRELIRNEESPSLAGNWAVRLDVCAYVDLTHPQLPPPPEQSG